MDLIGSWNDEGDSSYLSKGVKWFKNNGNGGFEEVSTAILNTDEAVLGAIGDVGTAVTRIRKITSWRAPRSLCADCCV